MAADGRRFPFDEAIWCTDAAAQPWLKETGLDTTDEGFIRVAATLESCNTPGVFACGDVAHLTASPRPKAGVFAVRAGPPLVANIRKEIHSWRLAGYRGASPTSISLLHHWFETEHLLENADGSLSTFRYYFAQRDALEPSIWYY